MIPTLIENPAPEFRASLAAGINAFHARTFPPDSTRFALALHEADTLVAGLAGVLAWKYLFVEALWVADSHRRQGWGARLLAEAERHAAARGCHAAWLDTFQARDFYLAQGYAVFGSLPDYPPGQTRYFLTKNLKN
jgi:GNAT superfamily N-acetyltransferase